MASRYSAQVKSKVAGEGCLLGRTGLSPNALDKLREMRDTVMRAAPGRPVTQQYYRIFR